MLGLLVGAVVGGWVVWKFTKGNAGPTRERVDELLGTVQQKSAAMLDRAKEQVSSGLENAREKVRAGGRRQDLPSKPDAPRSEGL